MNKSSAIYSARDRGCRQQRTPPPTSDSASQTSPIAGLSGDMGDEQPSTSSPSDCGVHASNLMSNEHIAIRREQRAARRRRRRTMWEAYRIPSSIPVKGESYCECPRQGRDLKCTCGEEDDAFDWCWDEKEMSAACDLSCKNLMSIFHASYSSGTSAVRGTQPMTDRQYFWEVKMTSPVYGTDMMVGVGTENVNLGAHRHSFTSMLGKDQESWGLSYYGRAQHKNEFKDIAGGKFGQGTILGVHVDMWHGTVSYYKNRRPLGVAYSGLAGKTLFPMVASTAARTAMKLIKACSFQTSLQFLCCQALRKLVPSEKNVIDVVDLPPGLRAFLVNNLSWLLRPSELSESTTRLTSGSSNKRSLSDDASDDSSESSEFFWSSDDDEPPEEAPPRPKRRRHSRRSSPPPPSAST